MRQYWTLFNNASFVSLKTERPISELKHLTWKGINCSTHPCTAGLNWNVFKQCRTRIEILNLTHDLYAVFKTSVCKAFVYFWCDHFLYLRTIRRQTGMQISQIKDGRFLGFVTNLVFRKEGSLSETGCVSCLRWKGGEHVTSVMRFAIYNKSKQVGTYYIFTWQKQLQFPKRVLFRTPDGGQIP